MKNVVLLIVLSLLSIAPIAAQTVNNFDLKSYKQIPDSLRQRENLVKYIVPDKNYTYWEFGVTEYDTTQPVRMVFSKGQRPENLIIKSPPVAFIAARFPVMPTAFYIVYVVNGKIGYVKSKDELIAFIGHIDNMQEAMLLTLTKENLFVDDKKIGGAYRIMPNGYDLMMMKYNQCPETKQAIQITVSPAGVIKKIPHRVYFYSKNCPTI